MMKFLGFYLPCIPNTLPCCRLGLQVGLTHHVWVFAAVQPEGYPEGVLLKGDRSTCVESLDISVRRLRVAFC
jgi:hypothetical protein